MKTQITDNINIFSEVLYEDINRNIENVVYEIQSLSAKPQEIIKNMDKYVSQSNILKDLSLINKDGKILSSVNYSQRELSSSNDFKESLNNEIVISDIQTVLYPFEIILSLYIPVLDDNGEVENILVGIVDYEKLNMIVLETSKKINGTFELVNSKAVIQLTDDTDKLLERYPVNEIYKQIINNTCGVNGTYYNNRRKIYFSIYNPAINHEQKYINWRVVFTKEYNELYKETILIKHIFQLRAVLAIILISFMSFYINKKFSKRIMKLNKATKNLGKGNFDYVVDEYGNDEISELFTEFINAREAIRSSELKLKISNNRYDLAVKGSHDVIWDWDLTEDTIYVGDKWWKLMNKSYSGNHSDYASWVLLIQHEDRDTFVKEINKCLSGTNKDLDVEYRVALSDGSIKWISTRGATVLDDGGEIIRIAGSHTDITNRKIMEQQMAFNAFYDALTDLPNRTMLLDRLKTYCNRARRINSYSFSVLFLDYDGFKHVNDTYGHSTGDLVLKEIAERLTEALRTLDLVARIGGDEFVILIDGISSKTELIPILNRINITSKDEMVINGNSIFISVSIGVSQNSDGNITPEEIIQQADIAMYQSKKIGKNTYTFFSDKLKEENSLRWSLEHELHKALGTKELTIYYQPIMDTKTKRIYSFEALLRWNHPEGGMIPPSEFIPAAEETGFITSLTKWLINTVCIQVREWNTTFNTNVNISFNVTTKDFYITGGLDNYIKEILVKTNCDPSWISLEVTESIMIRDFKNITKQLKSIREIGVKIKLDDFGTGYSSLSYLNKFEIDFIKIDRSFINTIKDNENSRKIVKSIILLAKDMNLKTVVEGVENKEEFDLVTNWGCNYIQGYIYSKALPLNEATEYILNSKTFQC